VSKGCTRRAPAPSHPPPATLRQLNVRHPCSDKMKLSYLGGGVAPSAERGAPCPPSGGRSANASVATLTRAPTDREDVRLVLHHRLDEERRDLEEASRPPSPRALAHDQDGRFRRHPFAAHLVLSFYGN
jgi:hypothetical protein